MINWKVRFKNPVFIFQFLLSILTPVLTYMGITLQDLTSWGVVFDVLKCAVCSPYVLGMIIVCVWNTLIDPTTAGFGDSLEALTYSSPKKSREELSE